MSSHKKIDRKFIEGRLTSFGTPYMQTVQVSRKTPCKLYHRLATKIDISQFFNNFILIANFLFLFDNKL